MTYPPAQLDSTSNYGTATNGIVTLTFAGVASYGWCIAGIAWSYSGTPTGGNITITDGGNTVFSVDVTTGGPGFVSFNPAMEATIGNTLVVTLAAGGAAIVGKLNLLGVWKRAQ